MSFMVKNPGMIPTLESVKAGDVGRRRQAMRGMFEGFWGACCSPGVSNEEGGGGEPFGADAIIANPPCFAHIHCAEALGVPLHLMFTFPYTPTQAFPHPLARVKRSNVEEGYTNWISYPLVEMMVWQGLGDLVNEFRVRTLGLDPVSTLWAPGSVYRLRVPFTYLWSPSLVPKPADWGDEVDVAGFVFVDLASSFKPPEGLVKFLEEGDEPPVYIGFGSIVVDDPDQFTKMIFEAVKLAGVRALVSKGWGGLGGDSFDVPPDVFLLDNTPHDWLFPRVRACVIHGGAGTTAIALKCGKPTMIVPFFGDQNFWGSMVGNAGAGPQPVPYKHLTVEKLADGIKYCITEKARKEAERIAKDIEKEGDGAENACRAFHRGLALQGKRSMRCSILPDRPAVWQLKSTGLQLSALAAEMLVEKGLVSWKKLRLLRHVEWNDFEGPGEPLTGAAGSLMTSVGNIFGGVGGVPYRIGKSVKERREKKKKRKKAKGNGADSGDGNRQDELKPDGPPQYSDDRQDVSQTIHRRETASTADPNPAEEVVRQVGDGAAKSASALARTPVDLALALAQGFHNAPRLYGDGSVRRPTRVTGIRSGLRAARREFVYGIYDGWTGVVRLPVRGAREEGACGFVSGVGMGLTGFVLKNIAAIIGPVGYTLQGVVKQAERGRQKGKDIRRTRVMQGQREVDALPGDERKEKTEEVAAGWRLMRQLWEEMKRAERKKEKGLRGRFRRSAKRLRESTEWNAVFENVDVAQRAIEALKSGDGLDSVLQVDVAGATGGRDKIADDKASVGSADKIPGFDSRHDSARGVSAEDVAVKPTPGTGGLEDDNPFSIENKGGTGRA
jgi:UDP:flavonoid glycosyltransferase YjiC (YdhE family)